MTTERKSYPRKLPRKNAKFEMSTSRDPKGRFNPKKSKPTPTKGKRGK